MKATEVILFCLCLISERTAMGKLSQVFENIQGILRNVLQF